MAVEQYIDFISKSSIPIWFIVGVVFCEYIYSRYYKKESLLSYSFSNFLVFVTGSTVFWLLTKSFLHKETVLNFASLHSVFHTQVTWTMFFVWFIIFDFINYATHVLYHKSAFFWMFHAVHHSDKHFNSTTLLRVPISSNLFVITSYAFFVFIGVNLDLLIAIVQTMFLHQVMTHSTLLRAVNFPSKVSTIFVTPEMHAVHHTEDHTEKNYGFVLSVWDSLFKTAHNCRYKGERFGLKEYKDTKNPIRIHLEPILSFIKKGE